MFPIIFPMFPNIIRCPLVDGFPSTAARSPHIWTPHAPAAWERAANGCRLVAAGRCRCGLNTGGTNRGHLSNKKSGVHRQKWGHSSISSTEIRDFTQQKSDFPSEKWDLFHRCAETAKMDGQKPRNRENGHGLHRNPGKT